MSGGHFEYQQYVLDDIADKILRLIEDNGRELTEQEMREYTSFNPTYFKEWPEDRYKRKFSDEVIEKFKQGYELLKAARIYAHRIDWLVSSDDNEQSFLSRLKKDLDDEAIKLFNPSTSDFNSK